MDERRLAVQKSLRLQLREQDHVADAFLAEESRSRGTQAVKADADANVGQASRLPNFPLKRFLGRRLAPSAGRRDARPTLSPFAAGPAIAGFQRGAWRDGIVLLGVAGRNFLAVDAALENLDGRPVVGPAPAGLASGTSSLGRCVTNVGKINMISFPVSG